MLAEPQSRALLYVLCSLPIRHSCCSSRRSFTGPKYTVLNLVLILVLRTRISCLIHQSEYGNRPFLRRNPND